MDIDTLLRLLCPSLIGKVERYSGFTLIKPPASETVIKVEGEKLALFLVSFPGASPRSSTLRLSVKR